MPVISPLNVAALQLRCTDQRDANWARIELKLKDAAAAKVQLVVLGELYNGHYFCQEEHVRHFDRAESVPGPTTEFLSALAKTYGLVIVGSVFERRAAGLYHNTAVVLDCDGSLAGIYRKMHIPDDPGYFEKYYFTPGDLGFKTISTSLGRLGVLVCWDQWYPEAARLMALDGAQLLAYPTAIGGDPRDSADEQQRQYHAWHSIQRSHAIANGIPVISSNRWGFESLPDTHTPETGIQFWGGSFICDSFGHTLAQAPADADSLLTATLDLGDSETTRRTWPFLRDRRIDAYHDLLKRYKD